MTYKLMPRQRPHRGFTLVELLVVVGVLAVLMGLLLPVLAQGLLRAQRTVCVSNLHQLSCAIDLYAQDWDGGYPTFLANAKLSPHAADTSYWHDHFCQGVGLQPGEVAWTQLLAGALSSPSVALCPSDGQPDERPVTSYEMKAALAQGLIEADVRAPSHVAEIWEQWSYHTKRQSEYDRHSEMNIAFADGHVRWVRLDTSIGAVQGSGPDLHWLSYPDRPAASQGWDFP